MRVQQKVHTGRKYRSSTTTTIKPTTNATRFLTIKNIFLSIIVVIIIVQTNTIRRVITTLSTTTTGTATTTSISSGGGDRSIIDLEESIIVPKESLLLLQATNRKHFRWYDIELCSNTSSIPNRTKFSKVLDNIIVYNRTRRMMDEISTSSSLLQSHDESQQQQDQTKTKQPKSLKILCFIITNSMYHTTRLPGVIQTWGKRCTKLIISSDVTDPTYNTISIKDITQSRQGQPQQGRQQQSSSLSSTTTRTNGRSKSGYVQLWNRLNETIQYIWDTYGSGSSNSNLNNNNETYDWYLKADDDSYIIYENLLYMLSSPDIMYRSNTLREPLVYGRQYSWVTIRDLYSGTRTFRQFFNFSVDPEEYNPKTLRRKFRRGIDPRKQLNSTKINGEFGTKFYNKFVNTTGSIDQPVIYPHGGAGYVMNNEYMKQFATILKSDNTLRGIPPEDLAHGAVMKYHNIVPQYSRDDLGLERFHPEPPMYMYESSISKIGHMVGTLNIDNDGPIYNGKNCCSPYTISFHHVTSQDMIDMDQILYC